MRSKAKRFCAATRLAAFVAAFTAENRGLNLLVMIEDKRQPIAVRCGIAGFGTRVGPLLVTF